MKGTDEDFPADAFSVARTEELPPGTMRHVECFGDRLLVANVDHVFYAVSDRCTHEDTPLHEGELFDGEIVCPLHFASFDVKTGMVIDPPAKRPLRVYPTFTDNGWVFVRPAPA